MTARLYVFRTEVFKTALLFDFLIAGASVALPCHAVPVGAVAALACGAPLVAWDRALQARHPQVETSIINREEVAADVLLLIADLVLEGWRSFTVRLAERPQTSLRDGTFHSQGAAL